MSDFAIRVDQLGKAYRIGLKQERHKTLTVAALSWLKSPVRNYRDLRRLDTSRIAKGLVHDPDLFWALRDVSFNITPGEVVGVIGRNGAGKSTLLKILSKITVPTMGRVEIRGRVSSLLEVGTGFHPELTGRENVYMNGTILGMSKREIDRKFDEIVDFSGIEQFIETPVKRYSSGMKVRLAFAVAAHLEPEVLIVDEVLAVGDAEFQQKCISKMEDVASSHRTVLFVSHNLSAVQRLCTRGIVIKNGQIQADANVDEAMSVYLADMEKLASGDLSQRADRRGKGPQRIHRIIATGPDEASVLRSGEPAVIRFDVTPPAAHLSCTFTIFDHKGSRLVQFASRHQLETKRVVGREYASLCCRIKNLYLKPGTYRIDATIRRDKEITDQVDAACMFDVVDGCEMGQATFHSGQIPGVYLPHEWHLGSDEIENWTPPVATAGMVGKSDG